jgi:hypothetical protein
MRSYAGWTKEINSSVLLKNDGIINAIKNRIANLLA